MQYCVTRFVLQVQLVEHCKYCMADALVPQLPCYFSPIVKELQPREVRFFCAYANGARRTVCMHPTGLGPRCG